MGNSYILPAAIGFQCSYSPQFPPSTVSSDMLCEQVCRGPCEEGSPCSLIVHIGLFGWEEQDLIRLTGSPPPPFFFVCMVGTSNFQRPCLWSSSDFRVGTLQHKTNCSVVIMHSSGHRHTSEEQIL